MAAKFFSDAGQYIRRWWMTPFFLSDFQRRTQEATDAINGRLSDLAAERASADAAIQATTQGIQAAIADLRQPRFFGAPPHVTVRSPNPSVYVLTAFEFNHKKRNIFIDGRFNSTRNYTFYFFDQEIDLDSFPLRFLREDWIFPIIAEAGRKHLAEWAFFLMEYHKKVLNYPFYVISSRFYEKNNRLPGSLDEHWDAMFSGLLRYGYGYLPSYDRDLSFIDMKAYYDAAESTLGTTVHGLDYITKRFGIDMQIDYSSVSDYWCNYIGFATREHFERYIEFYMPVFKEFFDEEFKLKKDYIEMGLVRDGLNFREYKPLTLLLELVSHLFFYKNQIPFFGLHYDGTYEVREWEQGLSRLSTIVAPSASVS